MTGFTAGDDPYSVIGNVLYQDQEGTSSIWVEA